MKIAVPDLLYLGWQWVACIFRAMFETFVLNNRGGRGGWCYVYLLSFPVLILQPVQAMQPSSQSVQYPAVSYPPQHLLPVSPTQQFSVVLKISPFIFPFLDVGVRCVSMSMPESLWVALRGVSHVKAPFAITLLVLTSFPLVLVFQPGGWWQEQGCLPG